MKRKTLLNLFIFIMIIFSWVNTKATYITSEKDFFNKLKYTQDMKDINTAQASGNYGKAKDELLKYFKNKFSKMNLTYTGWDRHDQVYLREYNAISYEEDYLGNVIVDSSEASWKSIDLNKNASGSYVLTALKASTDYILIASKDNSSKSPPQLVITKTDGTSKTFTPTKDSHVRAGKYADNNYGTKEWLYVKHTPSGTAKGSLPYSSDSFRSYITFDVPIGWKSNIKSVVLKVKVKLKRKTDGVKVDSSIPLVVMNAFYTNWTESNLTWNKIKKDNGFAHYSYNGIKGGFDWKQPEGSYSELFVHSIDFSDLMSLCKEADAQKTAGKTAEANKYYKLAKSILMDFINDNPVTPNKGFRISTRINVFPPVYNALLRNNILTSEENYRILRWVYNVIENEIYEDKSGMFDGTKASVLNGKRTAYTNHGVFYLIGYYSGLVYFKEFKDNSKWAKLFYQRFNTVYDNVINDDGSLNEATLFYAVNVISNTKSLMNYMIKFSDNTVMKKIRSKIIALGRYVMLCAFPNGYTPNWGDNISSAIKSNLKNYIVSLINEKDVSGTDLSRLREIKAYVNDKLSPRMAKFPKINIVTDRTGYTSKDSGIFMNAKVGGSHSHADALALLFYYDGRELLHDTGITSYNNKHFHYDWQKNQTKSHNTIEINNTPQEKYGTITLSGSSINISGNRGLSTITSSTKATEGFTHYRNVTYAKELGSILIVSDYVKPNNSKVNTYTQNWHTDIGTNSDIASDKYKTGKTNYSSGSNLIITQANTSNLSANIKKGYDKQLPSGTTKYFEYTKKASGNVYYQTVLYPVKSGTNTSNVKIAPTSLISNDKESAIKINVNDSNNVNSLIYSYTSFSNQITGNIKDGNRTIKTNTSHMIISYDKNSKIHVAYLNNGSSLLVNNNVVVKTTAKVTDVTVAINGNTLSVYSNDSKVKDGSIKVTINLGNQTINTVKLNDSTLSAAKYSKKGNVITINEKGTIANGDVNNDGKVTSTDYIIVRKHILKQTKLTGDAFTRGDLNGDNKITSVDYIAIRKIILNT